MQPQPGAAGRPRAGAAVLGLALSLAAVGSLYGTAFYGRSQARTDFGGYVLYLSNPRHPLDPHFLYEVLSRGLSRLLGFSLLNAGLLTALAAVLAATAITYVLLLDALPRRWGSWGPALLAAFVASVLQMVAPIVFATAWAGNLYLAYMAPNVYHNPTVVLLKPFGLLLMVEAAAAFGPGAAGLWTLVRGALWSFLSTVAKPSLALALVPALVVLAGATILLRRPLRKVQVTVLLGALGAVLLGQYLYAQNTGDPNVTQAYFRPGYLDNLYISYFHVTAVGGPWWLALRYLLSVAFPIAVLLLFRRTVLQDRLLVLAWVTMLFAAFVNFSFVEGLGDYALDGNYQWTGEIGVYLLFIASAIHVLRHGLDLVTWRTAICGTVFGLHLAAGLVFFAAHFHGLPWVV